MIITRERNEELIKWLETSQELRGQALSGKEILEFCKRFSAAEKLVLDIEMAIKEYKENNIQ